jgi:hypothetical protein
VCWHVATLVVRLIPGQEDCRSAMAGLHKQAVRIVAPTYL